MVESEEKAVEQCIEALQTNNTSAIDLIHDSITQFPNSYVLHFLLGSELAEQNNYPKARSALQTAIQLNGNLNIARIQLAMLEITHGELSQVNQLLEPLYTSAAEDAYHFFAKAIICVCNDDIQGAGNFVRAGISLNSDNPALNENMIRMLEIIKSDDDPRPAEPEQSASASADQESIQSALLDIYNTRAH